MENETANRDGAGIPKRKLSKREIAAVVGIGLLLTVGGGALGVIARARGWIQSPHMFDDGDPPVVVSPTAPFTCVPPSIAGSSTLMAVTRSGPARMAANCKRGIVRLPPVCQLLTRLWGARPWIFRLWGAIGKLPSCTPATRSTFRRMRMVRSISRIPSALSAKTTAPVTGNIILRLRCRTLPYSAERTMSTRRSTPAIPTLRSAIVTSSSLLKSPSTTAPRRGTGGGRCFSRNTRG
jgi:hypothetical protein